MAAQLGSNITLDYQPQGAQQSGAGVLLAYGASGTAPSRRVTSSLRGRWVAAISRGPTLACPHRPVRLADTPRKATWTPGHASNIYRAAPWVRAATEERATSARWTDFARRMHREGVSVWGIAAKSDQQAAGPWGSFATRLQPTRWAPWVRARYSDAARAAPWGGPLLALWLGTVAQTPPSFPVDATRYAPWLRFSRPLDPGWGIPNPPNTDGPDEPLYIIPLLRVYMTVHTLTAYTLPGLEPVALTDVTISTDDDSYGWSLSATGPEHLLDQLAPVDGLPARIGVEVDGINWVFAVGDMARTRKFGGHRVSLQASSTTSLLDAPYMPASAWLSSADMTAQQLAAQALDFTGVDLQWGITDWLVPAGAWSHDGTPLSAVLRIAEAAGAVVRSHRTNSQLQVAPRYPVAPWAWATAALDVQMPAAIITQDATRPATRPAWNAVYVSGTTQGVLGRVLRAGTAGDLLAPGVADPLITHVDAARQRGIAILGAGGRQVQQTMTLPLLIGGTQPGLIQPGQLIEVIEPAETWRGLVRSTQLTAAMPVVRQQITVERHL